MVRDINAPAQEASDGSTSYQVSYLINRELPGEDLPSEISCPPGLDANFLVRHNLLPMFFSSDRIEFAASHPLPVNALQAVAQKFSREILVRLANGIVIEKRLEALITENRALHDPLSSQTILYGDDLTDDLDDLDTLKALAEDAPVVRLAQDLLFDAIDRGASDLHLEIFRKDIRIRMRVDGILLDCPAPARKLYLPLISHLKLRAQMNIAERRLPQDGRIKMFRGEREVDIRVSTVPTVHGESMALRLLDQGSGVITISDLGLTDKSRTLLETTITLPHGMILVTGPTGSGKTTTLYAILGALNSSQKKIITVEDPVEYQIGGINQIQIKPLIDLTFANALRAIVRQDPDILMVGEIRDRDTAEIAIQSALTGHLVFSTLHTNDAASAPHRLLDMGIEPYLISSSVVLIIAQRLVRTLCTKCKTVHPIAESDRWFLKQHGLEVDAGQLAAAVGCSHCGGSGYSGRTGIFEMMPVTDPIKEAILRKAPAVTMQNLLAREGQSNLYADGLRKVISGETTLEELARVAREGTSELPALADK